MALQRLKNAYLWITVMRFCSIENILIMKNSKDIEFEIRQRLAVGKYKAGKALGWGRRATDAAIRAGAMPIIAKAATKLRDPQESVEARHR
jgi:hypothetical protein